jgi:hypothetical protein
LTIDDDIVEQALKTAYSAGIERLFNYIISDLSHQLTNKAAPDLKHQSIVRPFGKPLFF